jgi:hypothetical protein
MLRRLINGEIALGFSIATVFWIAALGWVTSYTPEQNQKNACYDAAAKSGHSTEECENFWEKTTSDPIATFTLVLAFSTVGLWVATLGLYVAGERHSERQLRAYIVSPVQAEIINFHAAVPQIVLAFINAGQTPAHNVRFFTTSAVAIFPLEERPRIPSHEPLAGDSIGVIGPQGTFHTDHASDLPVTNEERQAVIEGRCAFYVYGELLYSDAFGKERRTCFCYFYRGHSATRPNGPLASYHKWNEAT